MLLKLIPQLPLKNYSVEVKQRGVKIQQLHTQVCEMIEKQNEKYQQCANKHHKVAQFKEEDFVWIKLRKERFSQGLFGNLKPHVDGPFQIVKKINENVFHIKFSRDSNVSATFNMADLTPFYGPEVLPTWENDSGVGVSFYLMFQLHVIPIGLFFVLLCAVFIPLILTPYG